MLPHGTLLHMTNSNVPALQVVSIPAWNLYQSYDSDTQALAKEESHAAGDAADYFKALAMKNGIKVSKPSEETIRHCVSPNLSVAAVEFVPRNNSPESLPGTSQPTSLALPEISQTQTLISPTSTSVPPTTPNEDKKLLEMFQDVLNEKKQQYKILQEFMKVQEKSKSTISSLSATKAALDEEVEKLTSEVTELKERNKMLSDEVAVLTEKLLEMEDSNRRLKAQATTLLNRLQENENGHESNRTTIASLLNKLHEADKGKNRAANVFELLSRKYEALSKENEREKKELADVKEQLWQAKLDKECVESRAAMLADELHRNKLEKDRAETELLNLANELKQNNVLKERERETKLEEPAYSTVATTEKNMDSLDNINGLDNESDDDQSWTVVRRSKGMKSTKTSQNLAAVKSHASDKLKLRRSKSVGDPSSGESNGINCPKKDELVTSSLLSLNPLQSVHGSLKSHNEHNQHSATSQELLRRNSIEISSGKMETPNSDGCQIDGYVIDGDVTLIKADVNSNMLNTDQISSLPPCNKAVLQESSQVLKRTTTTIEPIERVDVSFPHSIQPPACNPGTSVDWLTNQLVADDSLQQGSTLSNSTDGFSFNPLLDPAVFDFSILRSGSIIPTPPGMGINNVNFSCEVDQSLRPHHPQAKDHTKLSAGKEKDKTRPNLSTFEALMGELMEKFPSKTRNELIQLLKLAKTSFGEQGFRKKKIDEIVKRVAEVIFPGNIKEETRKLCSICREDVMDDGTLLGCGHTFHKECLNKWIKTERTCPLCRSHALTEEEFPSLA